ncbi:MAG: segregation and condensation protein A [Acetivibrionales bacterium]|jgi:segregation and condensation protein A|nr:segregation/condensation protein A [Clostridiaceae bacterium]
MKSALTDACTLKLENFEGPFDLLFYLIEKNQIDIYDIPILEITEQYLDYLSAMQELDLDIASEFLVMAATLLHIKSRLLLPNKEPQLEEDTVDPREELIIKLLEYKKYKEYAKILAVRDEKWRGAHYKLPEAIPDIITENELEVSPETLRACMIDVLQRYRDKMNDVSKKMKRILNHEKVSLRSKVKELLGFLKNGVKLCFSKIYNKRKMSRLEIATGFLATLEVVRIGQALIDQPAAFGEIYLTPNKHKKNDTDPMTLIEDE